LNDRDEARDVLQDAFTDVFQSLDRFRYESSFGAWLKKIVVFKSINLLKRKQRQLAYIETTISETYEEQEEQNPQDFSVAHVKQAIAQLPEGSRTVFSLYLLEGYDHTEIAEIMNISESTSKTQYMRARNRVREILKEYGYEKR